jgi:tetratricopeptide (TPR) repeat protein
MMMKRFIFPVLVILCLAAFVADRAPVAAKDKWISLRTKNFFVMGNTGEKELRQAGAKLEQFRDAFTQLFPKTHLNTSVPTTVVIFKSDDSYFPFKIGASAGYIRPGQDVNYITFTTEHYGQQDTFSDIFHEYIHLLVKDTFKNAPVWFNEGLAKYYGALKIDDQKVTAGAPVANHVIALRESRLLSLKTLFEVDTTSPYYNETKKQGIFYAESWALMHYLIGNPRYVESLAKFLDLLNANVAKDQAFQQAFGMPLEAMETEFRNYVKQDRFNILNENKLALDSTAQITTLTEAESQAYLGDLMLHLNRAEALDYLQKAVKLDPNLVMANTSLGMAYFRQGKVAEARATLERAVAGNSPNYLAHYYYAFALSRFSPNETTPSTAYTPEMLAKMREHLQKAIALRPDFLDSYNLLAFVSLVTGENIKESIESLKKALSVSPNRLDFTFTLAQLYMRERDYKTSRKLLEQVSKGDEEYLRKSADMMLTQLTTMEEQVTRFEQMKKTSAVSSTPPSNMPGVPSGASGASGAPDRPPTMIVAPTKITVAPEPTSGTRPAPVPAPTPAADPSSYLREVLRTPATGESQLQGTLLRLECDAKGIVFVVQTETGVQRFRSATFDDVEITTYDTSVKGDITCGERKPTNAVVVVYVPNTDKRIKADGIIKSIEFVPAEFKLKPAP